MAKGPLGVQLYRSSVKGRRPQPAAMAYGDLAVNYHHEDPALIIKGDDNVLIEFKPGSGVTVSASAPATAKDGDLWWDPVSARLFLRYTSGTPPVAAWVDASPAAVPPTLANALTYKGTIDPTVALPSTVKLSIGDTYVASKAGPAHSSFTGLAGTAVGLHELLVWDGVEWDGAGAAASPRTAWQGQMDVTVAKPAGYVPTAGDVVEITKTGTLHPDWASMPAGVLVGAVLIFNGSSWDQLNTLPASTTLAGVVRLADAAAITAGTAGRVVDAAQLLAHVEVPRSGTAPAAPAKGQLWVDTSSTTGPPVLKVFDGTAWQAAGGGVKSGATAPTPAVAGDLWVDISTPASPVLKVYNGTAWVAVVAAATAAAAGIVQLADAAAITAGTAGRVVDAAQLKAATQDATTAAKGVVQLADAAAITAGTVGRVVDAAQLKANAVHVGETPPANPHQGSEWFRSSTGKLYVFYDDGAGAAQWVVANPQEAVDYSKAVLKAGDTMTGGLTLPSLVATTSMEGTLRVGTVIPAHGVSMEFTAIPSWAKIITLMFYRLSATGSSPCIVQVGNASGYVTAGYESYGTTTGTTTASMANVHGFVLGGNHANAYAKHGCVTLAKFDGNDWVCSYSMGLKSAATPGSISGGGVIALAAPLDRVRLTTVSGTDVFDVGRLNISYQG